MRFHARTRPVTADVSRQISKDFQEILSMFDSLDSRISEAMGRLVSGLISFQGQ
jgi:hypothetical protein